MFISMEIVFEVIKSRLLLPCDLCVHLTNHICHARSIDMCVYGLFPCLLLSIVFCVLFPLFHFRPFISNSYLMDLRKRVDLSFNICACDTTPEDL